MTTTTIAAHFAVAATAVGWIVYACVGAGIGWCAGRCVETNTGVAVAVGVGALGAVIGGTLINVAFTGVAQWWWSSVAAVIGAIGLLLIAQLISEKT